MNGRRGLKDCVLARLSIICLVINLVSVIGRPEETVGGDTSSLSSIVKMESESGKADVGTQDVSLTGREDGVVHGQGHHHQIRHGQHRKINTDDNIQGRVGGTELEVYGMTVVTSNKKVYYSPSGKVTVTEQEMIEIKLYGNFASSSSKTLSFSLTKVTSIAAGACNELHSLPYVPLTVGANGHTGSVKIQLPDESVLPVGYVCVRDSENVTVFGGTDDWLTIKLESRLLPIWLHILLIAFLLTLSGLFSGLNLGLMSLNKTDLKIIINTGTVEEKKCASKIAPVRNHGNFLLCCLLFSNVLVNTTLTILMDDITSGAIAIILSTFCIVTFGEIVPQAFCSRYGLKAGAKTIVITKFFMLVTFPLAYPMSKVLDRILGEEIGSVYTRERLKELLRVTKDHHGLENEEVGIISGALDMKTKTVRDVMTKLDLVFMLPSDAVLNFETMSEIEYHGYSRIPIYERERSNIVALLNVKQLTLLDASDNIPLRNVIEFYQSQLFYVFENTRLDYMFRAFREGNRGHMAFVQRVNDDGPGDPFYETIGIVTMEDVLEELLQAEIMDESDVGRGHGHPGQSRHADERVPSGGTPFMKKNKRAIFSEIPPTLSLAAVQFLSASVAPFKKQIISVNILRRLMDSHIKMTKGPRLVRHGQAPTFTYLYEMGKPSKYFMMVLEGRVQVRVGKENLMFEGGPFTTFGTEFLMANPDIQEGGKGVKAAEKGVSAVSTVDAKSVQFLPDYTVKVLTDIAYFCISYAAYKAAKLASEMERNSADPSMPGNTNWEADFEKVLSDLEEQ